MPMTSHWLKVNKVSLNVDKTEPMLFTSPKKQADSELKMKLNGKRLYATVSLKYLGIQIDKSLSGNNHAAIKLK